jgi:hypothetical protein
MIDTCTAHVLCTLKCFKKDLTHKNGGLWWALDDVQTMSSLPANMNIIAEQVFFCFLSQRFAAGKWQVISGPFFAYPLVI